MKGKLVRVIAEKGFCFVECKGTKYFVHRSAYRGNWDDLIDDNAEGLEIHMEFEEEPSDKGPRGTNARRIG